MKTIKITMGGFLKKELLAKLQSKSDFISNWAIDLINQKEFEPTLTTQDVSFKLCSIKDLILDRPQSSGSPTTSEIMNEDHLKSLGLTLCEPEDALYLPLNFEIKNKYEWHSIMHRPIMDSFEQPSIISFRLEDSDNSGLRIGSIKAFDYTKWSGEVSTTAKNEFMFFRAIA